ncbi:MAG: hypothetical protein HY913_22375 [Desulfomonile tiedjei]|nr:hypothetical protein [Desulfomonile tiedjei]
MVKALAVRELSLRHFLITFLVAEVEIGRQELRIKVFANQQLPKRLAEKGPDGWLNFFSRSNVCKRAFIVAVAFLMAFAWTFAHGESAVPAGEPSTNLAEPDQQDDGKSPDRVCPQCGEKVAPEKACKSCGRIFRGSTGGVDPTTGVQNRLKSDFSNIDRTKSNINQSTRSLNNNLRNMNQNIFRIRDIRRRL